MCGGAMVVVKSTVEHANNPNHINGPCIRYGCLENVTVEVLRDYLFINGFDKGYTRWIWHGESTRDKSVNSNDRKCDEWKEVDCSESDKLEDMIYDVEDHFVDHPHLIQSLKDDA